MQRFELAMMGLSWLVAGDELTAPRQFLPALFTVILTPAEAGQEHLPLPQITAEHSETW